jgi:beta-glucosidase
VSSAFPQGFVWGAATSAYQIEGAAFEHGRGPSVWDSYCRDKREGTAVWLGQTGDVACDHVHRYAEDVGLMHRAGLHAYRFSISWTRVIPEGTGKVSEAGLGFYDRLVDELLSKGVTPWATLFHWDYPMALFNRGGWGNRESVRWFAEYTRVVVDRLSDRVKHWMTINEPHIFIGGGPDMGPQAPGTNLPIKDRLHALHHVLLAHAESVRVIRAHAKTPPKVGWAPCGVIGIPATDSAEDHDAAKRWTHGVRPGNLWNNAWYADPILLGGYPEEGLRVYGANAPKVLAGDMEAMLAPLDFYGVNIYNGTLVRAGGAGGAGGNTSAALMSPRGRAAISGTGGAGTTDQTAVTTISANPSLHAMPGIDVVDRPIGYDKTALDWPIEPESLRYGPLWLHQRYKLPIYITENGLSAMDWVHADGKVHDPQRIDFTRRYLLSLRQAVRDGAEVGGYFHWSFLDNFEWESAFKHRFGLVHVDYTTQKRTPKDSFEWYAKVVKSNGAWLDENPFA